MQTTEQPNVDGPTSKEEPRVPRGPWWKRTICDLRERHKRPSHFRALNVLLVFIPLSWIFHFIKLNNTLVFVFSFLAIVPLAKLLAFATEELSLRMGQTLAGLLNATLVRLIIIALVKCELTVVQSSRATQLNSSLLTLSVIGVLLPAAFHNAVQPSNGITITLEQERHDILAISHGVAIILLFIYGCYLFFQLFSHKNLYEDDSPESMKPETTRYAPNIERRLHITPAKPRPASSPPPQGSDQAHSDNPQPNVDSTEAGLTGVEEDDDEPQMSVPMTIGLLVVITVLVALTAEFLVDSINGLTSSGHISKQLLASSFCQSWEMLLHVTAVMVSVKDKLTLSLNVAVGSSIQIALFVIPFIVTLGWILGKPLTLLFDPFQSIVLFLSVLTVNYVVQDGKSNWLEGMILMCLYIIVAVTFWFYPGSDLSVLGVVKCT
ncbi:hypothetical protein BGW80DRAFT_1316937 [Lactifluus volemus]|nr:hypothetical protein BGW80DRAFT_1316937 [Lactifluus volemus]